MWLKIQGGCAICCEPQQPVRLEVVLVEWRTSAASCVTSWSNQLLNDRWYSVAKLVALSTSPASRLGDLKKAARGWLLREHPCSGWFKKKTTAKPQLSSLFTLVQVGLEGNQQENHNSHLVVLSAESCLCPNGSGVVRNGCQGHTQMG